MEGGAAREPLGIPVNVLPDLLDRPFFTIMGLGLQEMMIDHLFPLFQRRTYHRLFFRRNEIVKTEDPGVPQCSSSNHHSVTARFLYHLLRQKRRGHVSISEDGNIDRLFHLADQAPICPAAKPLNLCPGMD